MVRQASSISFIFLRLFLVLFNKVECKSSGSGHYSSQRTLGSGSSSSHGITSGNQLQNSMHWSNSWLPLDLHPWYDYGT